MPKKTAPPKTMHVSLEKDRQGEAKVVARRNQTTMALLFADIVTAYAAGPMPEPRRPATPQSEKLETRIEVPQAVYERARQRARAEGVHLSDVVAVEVRTRYETEDVAVA